MINGFSDMFESGENGIGEEENDDKNVIEKKERRAEEDEDELNPSTSEVRGAR
jgi:hypothetical protein